MGGLAAQEAIKALTGKDAPVLNWLIFDGTTGAAANVRIPAAAPSVSHASETIAI